MLRKEGRTLFVLTMGGQRQVTQWETYQGRSATTVSEAANKGVQCYIRLIMNVNQYIHSSASLVSASPRDARHLYDLSYLVRMIIPVCTLAQHHVSSVVSLSACVMPLVSFQERNLLIGSRHSIPDT